MFPDVNDCCSLAASVARVSLGSLVYRMTSVVTLVADTARFLDSNNKDSDSLLPTEQLMNFTESGEVTLRIEVTVLTMAAWELGLDMI